jgi:hypothetical protein
LTKTPQKAARPQAGTIPVGLQLQSTRNVNIFSKVKGLLTMAVGATLVGFGMGGVDMYIVGVLIGLEVLLLGFLGLAD